VIVHPPVKRIVTRPDFDGIVCAALLRQAESLRAPILWTQPGEMQRGRVAIEATDVVANLPYDPRCALWFDHHDTNRPAGPFRGVFKPTPSAARIVFDYYRERFKSDYRRLVAQTDRIDSADLTLEEVLEPQNNPYLLLSLTVAGDDPAERGYWDRLVQLLGAEEIEHIMAHRGVRNRCREANGNNRRYRRLLEAHTRVRGPVSVTDFRDCRLGRGGNRFLVYALFPQTVVNVKIAFKDKRRSLLKVSLGHNIFNRRCRVHLGRLLAGYGGGGHRTAASCIFAAHLSDRYLTEIVGILERNQQQAGEP
jgi:hypothetical protein